MNVYAKDLLRRVAVVVGRKWGGEGGLCFEFGLFEGERGLH